MAKKAKEVAALSSIIAFFVMHASINGMLTLTGVIENNLIVQDVLTGSIANVCGILSLQMGVFGGIIVGLGVSYLHNRFMIFNYLISSHFLKVKDLYLS